MNKFKIILIASLLIVGFKISSQINPTYTSMTASLNQYNSTSLTFTNGIYLYINSTDKPGTPPRPLRERNKSAKVLFKLDLGEDYIKQSAGWKFNIEVNLTYTLGNFTAGSSVVKTFTINQTNPELLVIDDILQYFTTTSPVFGATVTNVTIDDGNIPSSPLTSGLLKNYIESNLRLTATIIREYDVDVRLHTTTVIAGPPIITPPTVLNRLVTFQWQPNGNASDYPDYEIQILKLNNLESGFAKDNDKIATIFDWQRALKIQTQSYKRSITLNLLEGSGLYIWRVRPIGNYFEGGIANSENYGEWSSIPTLGSNATYTLSKSAFSPTNISNPCILNLNDPDEELNWIYNRVFTEGDDFDKLNPTGVKSSEGINYADKLLNIKQSQKFNSVEDKNLVSQNILDYTGRQALSTIPVPIPGGLTGYKLNLVTNNNGDLYTAKHFDAESNFNDPQTVKDVSNPFSYYSGNSNVPDAEGYLFKRTLFKNDGTGRVTEESGVGKTHALGTQTSGRGRTTRISYAPASEDELIRIFGDEAPLGSSVIKTTTIDQNNVESITYTSKEGKTIATALLTDNTNNLTSLQRSSSPFLVVNTIKENMSLDGRVVSSKKVVIPGSSATIKLSYTNAGLPGAGSGCPTGNCNLKMRFSLTDVKNNLTYKSDAISTTSQINEEFTPSSGFSFPSTWVFRCTETPATVLTPAGANHNEIVLNGGEYIFTKEIYPALSNSYGDSLVNIENGRIKPIIDAIINKMQYVKSVAGYTAFLSFMDNLKTHVDGYNSTPPTVTTSNLLTLLDINPTSLPAGYQFPNASEFNLPAIESDRHNPESFQLKIETGCCGVLNVPIPKLLECNMCGGDPDPIYQNTISIHDMITTNSLDPRLEIIPFGVNDLRYHADWNTLTEDEQREALYPLVKKECILPFKEKLAEEGIDTLYLWKLAPGFSFESITYMISNMLISKYYTGRAIEHSGNWYKADVSPSGAYIIDPDSLVSQLKLPFNYDCNLVYNSWMASFEMINTVEAAEEVNIVKEYNDREGNNAAQNFGDDDENWSPNLRKIKNALSQGVSFFITKFGNSKAGKVSVAQQESITQNVIKLFFDGAGYQFAAILDGSNLPSYITASSDPFIPADYLSHTVTPFGSNFYRDIPTGTYTHINVPLLFTVNNNVAQETKFTCLISGNNIPSHELYYPYILKPEWMFKYFVYNVYENSSNGGFILDDSLLIPHQVNIDIARGYNEPFSYLDNSITSGLTSDDLCTITPTCGYSINSSQQNAVFTHFNWSAAERLEFYNQIKNAPKCPSDVGFDNTGGATYYTSGQPLPNCSPKSTLISEAIQILDKEISNCDNLAGSIKSALEQELANACYTVVPCKTGNPVGIISNLELNIMVDSVISNIKSQIKIIKQKVLGISPTTAISACSNPSLFASTYNTAYANSLCDYPACSEINCKEIVFYHNNTLGLVDSRKFEVKYFPDCDQKILDMISTGSFLPDIPNLANSPCTSRPPKVWKNCGTTTTNCDPDYKEYSNCSGSEYEKYSKKFSVTAQK